MDRRCAGALSGIARRTPSFSVEINILSYACGRRAAPQPNRMRRRNRRPLKSDMRYPQTVPLLSPQGRANATEPFRIRFGDIRLLATYPGPDVDLHMAANGQSERMAAFGRLTLPRNGEMSAKGSSNGWFFHDRFRQSGRPQTAIGFDPSALVPGSDGGTRKRPIP